MIYQDAKIKVTAVENSHFDFHKGSAAGKHKSYSYRFETPDRVIVFPGDTGPSDAVTELAKRAIYSSPKLSCEDWKQTMINDSRCQAMTPAEQEGIILPSKPPAVSPGKFTLIFIHRHFWPAYHRSNKLLEPGYAWLSAKQLTAK